jgi:hypothetical protein
MRIGYRWLIGVLSVIISLTEFYYDFDNHADEVAFGGHYLLQHVKTAFNQTRRQLWMGKHILYASAVVSPCPNEREEMTTH